MDSSEKLRGLIFVMIGPGGAGKNAIMKAIIEEYECVQQLATATTRPMRADERQGREHLFVSLGEFRRMLAEGRLLEHQEVTAGKYYGIPRRTVCETLASGAIRIADIEVLGAEKLRAAFPHNVAQIFVTVPGETIDAQMRVLERRMRSRDDGMTDIEQRLERARRLELPYQIQCDYVVVNDRLERAIEKTRGIVEGELVSRGLIGARA